MLNSYHEVGPLRELRYEGISF